MEIRRALIQKNAIIFLKTSIIFKKRIFVERADFNVYEVGSHCSFDTFVTDQIDKMSLSMSLLFSRLVKPTLIYKYESNVYW